MSGDKLSDLRRRLLALLAGIEPRWTLTGGAALAGFHTKRRPTRDLDLFWRNRVELVDTPRDVAASLRRAGLEVDAVRTTPTFHQLRVSDGIAVCTIDLVADAGDSLEPPVETRFGDVVIRIDSAHELLVNKLCALLSRSELRDLADIEALLERGGDLDRAIADAPRKDGGFSVLTLAWLLESFEPRLMATAEGWSAPEVERIVHFRDALLERVLAAGAPQ